MKQNFLQNVISFIFKYIWLFCVLLILLEIASVSYTAGILMRQTASGVKQSIATAVSGRVEEVLSLLEGMASDERFADTSKPLFDRVILARPYQLSYGLYMIAMTDKDVNVISADELEPPTESFSLAYRDYMQQLYKTGEYQITDAFLSGDGKETMNYTIAVPILKDGKTEGSIFGSIYFDEIEEIIEEQSQQSGRNFYLFGSENTVMAGEERTINGKSFIELSENSFAFNNNHNNINENMKSGKSGDFWEWDSEGLTYVTYQRVEPTNWTILYRSQFIPVFARLLPILIAKIGFYVMMCGIIYALGRRYLNRYLSQIDHLLNRVATMQKQLFHSEQLNYDNLLDITQKGLTDHLTGLSTRAILFMKMKQQIEMPNAQGVVAYIDLDDLKRINDNFGHEGGDYALLYFAKILKEFETKYDGIASRYGGDEFILSFNYTDHYAAIKAIEELCNQLNTTISAGRHNFVIHGSIGTSFYPDHGQELEELISKADLALYAAKHQGKNRCEFYSNEK